MSENKRAEAIHPPAECRGRGTEAAGFWDRRRSYDGCGRRPAGLRCQPSGRHRVGSPGQACIRGELPIDTDYARESLRQSLMYCSSALIGPRASRRRPNAVIRARQCTASDHARRNARHGEPVRPPRWRCELCAPPLFRCHERRCI